MLTQQYPTLTASQSVPPMKGRESYSTTSIR